MKTATSLTLIAASGIIAFAITAHLAFLNLQVTGWVLILTGAAGAIVTRNSWRPLLRRTLVAEPTPPLPRPAAPASARHRHRAPPRQAARDGLRRHASKARPPPPQTVTEYAGT